MKPCCSMKNLISGWAIMRLIQYFIMFWRKALANKNGWIKSYLMKSMLWHKLNKGLSSTSNWISKYITNCYFQSTQHIALHSTLACWKSRQPLHFGQRASLHKSWTQFPISAFHSANPSRYAGKEHFIPEPKSWIKSAFLIGKPSLWFSWQDFRRGLLEPSLENP